ncbi:MAG: hypothetical protein WBG86_06110 [Polyangiales bacterium]
MTVSSRKAAALTLLISAAFIVGGGESSTVHGKKKDRNPSEMNLNQFLGSLPSNGRFVLFRSYLPANGRDNVKLPNISVVENGTTTDLPECPWRETSKRDHFAAELAAASSNFNIRRIVRIIARIIGLDPSGPAPYCSWWFVVDNVTFNIAYPDAAATYWATPFLAQEGTDLVIHGEYGDMRYTSFGIYNQKFNYYEYSTDGQLCPDEDPGRCFGSYITDYQIEPDVPGTSPYQTEGAPTDSTYTVTMTTQPQNTAGNVLPTLVTQSGCLPGQPQDRCAGAENNDFGDGVGISQGLFPAPCNFANSPFTCTVQSMFSSPPTAIQSSVVSNPDNAYVPTLVDARNQILPLDLQEKGRVYVIRGKLPRTPLGTEPVVWPDNENYDMRYWSMCTAVYFVPYPTTESPDACVADLQINRTNKAGVPKKNGNWYTIVVSTEDSKPKGRFGRPYDFAAVGANWLEATNLTRTILVMRNMVPSVDSCPTCDDGFKQAAQNAPRDGSWISLFKALGNYYPAVTAWCTTEHFEENGWGGCVGPKIPNTGGQVNDDPPESGVPF